MARVSKERLRELWCEMATLTLQQAMVEQEYVCLTKGRVWDPVKIQRVEVRSAEQVEVFLGKTIGKTKYEASLWVDVAEVVDEYPKGEWDWGFLKYRVMRDFVHLKWVKAEKEASHG
jgi:hypothetical protein